MGLLPDCLCVGMRRWGRPLLFAALALAALGSGPARAVLAPERAQAPAVAADWRNPWPEGGSAAPAPSAERAPYVAALAYWWRSFDDPHLNLLLERALSTHTSVRAAAAALQQARALQAQTQAAQAPQVQASLGAQNAQVGLGDARGNWRAGLEASWELDWFGQRAQAASASAADARAATAQLDAVRVSLAAEVGLRYLEWRLLQQREQQAQRRLRLQEEFEQIVGWRVQAGLMSEQDRQQARLDLALVRAGLPEITAARAQAEAALALLSLGSAQAALDLPATPIPLLRQSLARAIPSDTLRQRPDLRRAEERLLAASARLLQADAARLPTLALSGSFDWRRPSLSELFDPVALTRTLLLRLGANLFDGGAAQARVQAQQAALLQAQLELEAALQTALREVEQALSAVHGSAARLHHWQDAVQAARAADALALQRLRAGLIDYRIWFDARLRLLNAESELLTAQAAWGADHVRLYQALGGGWSSAGEPAALPNQPTAPAAARAS